MKNVILITLFATLLLYSCRRDINNAVFQKDAVETSQFTKEVILPDDPCKLITVDMVTAYFNVQQLGLDFEDNYSKCGYSWKKSNFEELRELQINAIFNYAKKESESTSTEDNSNEMLSDAIEIVSPYNTVQVGNFIRYKSLQDAIDRFTLLHKVPTKEEMDRLRREMKKQVSKENLKEEALDIDIYSALKLSKNLKFKKIDGVGDQAYYDFFDKSLDVRYGIISFKLYIDSEKELETNIEIAKELADIIWKKL